MNTQIISGLSKWIEAFLRDRQAQGFTPGTVRFYAEKLRKLRQFCERESCELVTDISPDLVRSFLLGLKESGHKPGGIHACYRAAKAFLRWYEEETEPGPAWCNPFARVKAPRVPQALIDPVELSTVQKLLDACGKNWYGLRDRAVILFLLDTGARAGEVCAVDRADVDLVSGAVSIRKGKGQKGRVVFVGRKTRRALRAYLKGTSCDTLALWVTREGERLSFNGLREIIRRRSKDAGIHAPGLHDFRRAFALNMLRAGVDPYSLQKLMGHNDLQVLRLYLKQTNEDLQAAHQKGSPVDRMDERRPPIDHT